MSVCVCVFVCFLVLHSPFTSLFWVVACVAWVFGCWLVGLGFLACVWWCVVVVVAGAVAHLLSAFCVALLWLCLNCKVRPLCTGL